MKLNSDIGGIIWLIIIGIGVISNIVKKARAARPVDPQVAAQAAAARAAAIAAQRARLAQVAAAAAPVSPPVKAPAPVAVPTAPSRPAPMRPAARAVRAAAGAPTVVAATVDPFADTAMPFDAPAPPPPIVHDSDMGLPTGVPKRFFENRQSLIWAVIMSEVLGKPKALAVEQNLWSPQHQPPST